MSVENTHFGSAEIAELLKDCKSIFFIGIGGINMSSLAHISHNRGYRVGGSDRTETELTRKLAQRGIRVNYGHSVDNARGYDAFVYTVAISEDNPEYVYARKNGLPCISRADYLGYIMTRYKRRIGIAGMHGKSTCTSMCAEILIECGSDPTVLSGAELPAMNGAYCVGESDNFVFEACEYMDSFLDFNPTVAVILNIELDHVDYFSDIEQIKRSFARYADIAGKDGYAVYNADDKDVIEALKDFEGERVSFGIEQTGAVLRAENITEYYGKYSFDIIYREEFFCHVDLRTSGYHNIYNALAAAGACLLCGICAQDIAKGLEGFCGACRRMEYKGSVGGAEVYDDYGHHPTEIASTLRGARGLARGKLICVYQPHTYSRTAALIEDFIRCFDICDKVIFVDIYAAREKDTLGVSSALLAERVGDRAGYAESFEQAAKMLEGELCVGDVAIVMGAGDVYKVFEYLTFSEE